MYIEKLCNILSVYTSDFVRQNRSESKFLTSESWVILSAIEQRIKAKIESVGTPLKDWDINIYRGVLTGYNEAFIIDGKKRNELIEADPKSAEIIRPILRGRDIKRYGYHFSDLWLINAHNGIKEKGIKPINIENYPAIKAHLDQYYDILSKRADKGVTPYNLRHCAYMEDFSKQKIVWGEISDRTKFSIDLNGEFVMEATTFLLSGNSLLYLLAFLNSKISEYFFSKIGTTTGVGTVRWKKFTIEQLSVPRISLDRQLLFDDLVSQIIEREKKKEDYNEILSIIDNLIYTEIGLSDEEICFIESQ